MTTIYAVTGPDHKDWLGREFRENTVFPENDHAPTRVAGYKELEVAPFLQPFCDPVHRPVYWKCHASGRLNDHGLAVAASRVTAIAVAPVAAPTLTQRQRFAIVCAASIYPQDTFLAWANKWLGKEDRSAPTALAMLAALDAAPFDPQKGAAYAALAGVAGLRETPQHQDELAVYCAAAAWTLHTQTGGLKSLAPATRFALLEK